MGMDQLFMAPEIGRYICTSDATAAKQCYITFIAWLNPFDVWSYTIYNIHVSHDNGIISALQVSVQNIEYTIIIIIHNCALLVYSLHATVHNYNYCHLGGCLWFARS